MSSQQLHDESSPVPGFSWIIDSELAGMKFPSTSEHYSNLSNFGIGLVICVNERLASFSYQNSDFNLINLQKSDSSSTLQQEFNFHSTKLNIAHFPINDYGVPNHHLMNQLIELVNQYRIFNNGNEQKRGIVTHCMAGLSRTGMILACLLVKVWKKDFHEAIKLVNEKRGRNGRGVMTSKQEAFVEEYSNTIVN